MRKGLAITKTILLGSIFSLFIFSTAYASDANIDSVKETISTASPIAIAIAAIVIILLLVKKAFQIAVKVSIIAVIVLIILNYQYILGLFK